MSPRRVPVSRRDRPAKPPLSREAAVAAAVRIMRDEGLERLTMRRLAAALDTGPASLYVYVRNMAELHGAILDDLLAGLQPPEPEPAEPEPAEPGQCGQWQHELTGLLTAYTELLFQYPSLARSVLTLRPSGRNYLRLIDTLLGLLLAGGVPASQAAWGVDLLLQHATATAAEQGTRDESADAADEHQLLVQELREAPAGEYPSIARAREELFSGTGAERLAWAVTALLSGLRAVPVPAGAVTAG
jgi:AcrR family transcriptional regulator